MSFVPSTAQQGYFEWIVNDTGNAVVVAVAGAGKTTTIVHGLRLMVGRKFVGAYNSKMAKELQERTTGMTDVTASTFHSAGFKALKFAFGKTHGVNLEEKKVKKICELLIEEQGRDDLKSTIGTICKVVSMAKNRGIGALTPIDDNKAWFDMVDHYDLDSDLPDNFPVSEVVEFSKIVLTKSNEELNIIDFDDMVYLPIQKNLRMFQYDWVMIDEAQDTNSTRRAMAAKMLKPTGRLVAVGDPCQAIFGFTGADNDSLDQIVESFKAKRMFLTITYRCPKAVVKHARNWVSHIEAGDSAPEGSYSVIPMKNLIPMVTNTDAIICRYNKYLVALCFKLIRAGIPAKIEGRSIGEGLIRLCDKWNTKNIDVLQERLEDYLKREVDKALTKGQEDKADRVKDQVETVFVLIERARDKKMSTVQELKDMITTMFADNVSSKGILTLCSAHKSKGMEWDRVFILGRSELMPSKMAKQAWQLDQERNLCYVAITRAKKDLVEVTGVEELIPKKPSMNSIISDVFNDNH